MDDPPGHRLGLGVGFAARLQDGRVQLGFRLAPAQETVVELAEHLGRAVALGRQAGRRLLDERDHVGQVVLGALAGQIDARALGSALDDLGPIEPADLGLPLAGQDQQLDDAGVVRADQPLPSPSTASVASQTSRSSASERLRCRRTGLARLLMWRTRRRARVPLVNTPGEEGPQRG